VIHHRYLFGSLDPSAYEAYKARNRVRAMITNSLVKIKEAPPYSSELEVPVFMNSMARATLDPKAGSYVFPQKLTTEPTMDVANVTTAAEISSILEGANSIAVVGVDQGKWSESSNIS